MPKLEFYLFSEFDFFQILFSICFVNLKKLIKYNKNMKNNKKYL